MNTMTLNYAQGGLAAADRIRAQGRGQDSMLVHMTPGEVQALQAMAEQHGGSLTINPHTGLPEAGFLSGLLSVAAPIALSYFGGPALGGMVAPGASAAMQAGIGAGLIAGGLTTLTTGDIGKGLTSGLISGGLTGAMSGWNPTAPSAPGAATSVVKTVNPAYELAKSLPTVADDAVSAAVNTPTYASMMQHPSVVAPAAQVVAPTVQQAAVQPDLFSSYLRGSAAVPGDVSSYYSGAPFGQAAVEAAPAQSSGLFGSLGDKWNNLSTPAKLGIGAVGLAGLGGLSQPKFKTQPTDKGTIRPYEYKTAMTTPQAGQSQFVQGRYDEQGNPILDTRERNYFNQSFNALPTYGAANGGLMAAGSMDQNNMYPQSQQVNTNFATPTQMPTSAEVVASDYDAKTNAYTGEEMPRMADGGSTYEYTYDPAAQKYALVPPPVVSQSGGMGKPDLANNPQAFIDILMNRNNAPAPSPVQQQNPFMSLFSKLGQQTPSEQQYSYDPQTQTYIKLAEGGDITEGYKGYGQDNQGRRNPLELLKALQANQEKPQQQTTVIRQASGGLSNLGSYSDGGHLLKGPGNGISDDIPATIGQHQPARLANNEFVIPARIVSEIGQGSTDAGAKRLYEMMERVQERRKKSIGKGNIAKDTGAYKEVDKL